MERYVPPFTITNQMLMLVAEIAEKTGSVSNFHSFETKPHLRRNNRIRSIHSSLAIEANSLSLDEVRSVISGKMVIGPQKEIQEVKNAYQAYEQMGRFDPYSLEDLKRLHGIMTYLTVQESGVFRSHNEGVFKGDHCIFMAPPPHLVPGQMQALFDWMGSARAEVHPLILSSVFHYEFVFIHPFSDGNGRMARLWQTALLSEWNPIFQYLPLESRIQEFQDGYYDAIDACHGSGKLFSFSYLVGWIDMCFSSLFTALGHPVQSLLVSFFGTLVFPIVFLFILTALWGLNGVWLMASTAAVASGILTVILAKTINLQHPQIPSQS